MELPKTGFWKEVWGFDNLDMEGIGICIDMHVQSVKRLCLGRHAQLYSSCCGFPSVAPADWDWDKNGVQ